MVQQQKIVFGIDEVGRGPLAGPVVACALKLSKGRPLTIHQRSALCDSKRLSAKQRKEIFATLKKDKNYVWALGKVGERVIDKINIFQASRLAMKRAVLNLEKKLGKKADLLLIDGNFALPIKREQQSIIKGDEKVALISLASIIAKVSRDRLMEKYHSQYPEYGFQQHKGYPTEQHKIKLANYGPCKIHRYSFKPVAHFHFAVNH